jgi:regulatory protein
MPSAYLSALTMLSRRDLSERQLRDRLARKKFSEEEIDDALSRLRDQGAANDGRVAEAIARTAVTIKRRGRLRVKREIETAGISPAIARQALDVVFGDVDSDALLEAALARKLREGRTIDDAREFKRLYRYLAAQGFESDKIVAVLKRRSRAEAAPPGEGGDESN